MTTRTVALIGLLCLGTAGGFAYAPPVQAGVDIDVDIAPPAPRYERVVVRPGYVWTPGYYRYENRRYVWVGGNYVVERQGYRWRPHRWVQMNGRWHYAEGGWDPDDHH
jgi:hypothetical protein